MTVMQHALPFRMHNRAPCAGDCLRKKNRPGMACGPDEICCISRLRRFRGSGRSQGTVFTQEALAGSRGLNRKNCNLVRRLLHTLQAALAGGGWRDARSLEPAV